MAEVREGGRSRLLRRLHDFPVRILSNDLAMAKFQKVAATDHDLLAVFGCACQGPLRHAVIARNPVMHLSVVNVGDALKPCRQTLSNGGLADISPPPRVGAARQHELTVVGKEAHHCIVIMRVEGCNQLRERVYRHSMLGPYFVRAKEPGSKRHYQRTQDLASHGASQGKQCASLPSTVRSRRRWPSSCRRVDSRMSRPANDLAAAAPLPVAV